MISRQLDRFGGKTGGADHDGQINFDGDVKEYAAII